MSDAPAAIAGSSGLESNALEERCRQWYCDHGPAVYGYFRFHVPSIDVAEDLTAETFLKLVRSARRYDPAQGSARVWILAIARNVLRDWGRRGRLRQYVALGNLHDLEWDAPSPEERLLREGGDRAPAGRGRHAGAGGPGADRAALRERVGRRGGWRRSWG